MCERITELSSYSSHQTCAPSSPSSPQVKAAPVELREVGLTPLKWGAGRRLCLTRPVCVQASSVAASASMDAGDPTAPTAAPARTEVPAPRRTGPASARRATAEPTAGGVKTGFQNTRTHTHVESSIYSYSKGAMTSA